MELLFMYGDMYIPKGQEPGCPYRHQDVQLKLWGKTHHIVTKKIYVDGGGQPQKPECDANTYMEEQYPSIAEQLDRSQGAFYSGRGFFETPMTLLAYVKEHRYTLQRPRLEVYSGNNGYTHNYIFHGNLCEASCEFHYKIFSLGFMAHVREAALDRAIYPGEDADKLAPVLVPCPACGGVARKPRSPNGFALWAVSCKCGHRGPVRHNDDLAAYAWNDGLTE